MNFLFMPGSVAAHAKTNPNVRIGRTIRFHRNMRSAFWLHVFAVLAWERIVRTVVSVGEGSDGKDARVETHLEPLSSAREDVLVFCHGVRWCTRDVLVLPGSDGRIGGSLFSGDADRRKLSCLIESHKIPRFIRDRILFFWRQFLATNPTSFHRSPLPFLN